MASDPITGLPPAAALNGADPIVTVQGGVTVQSDVDAMKAFMDASQIMQFKGQADASAVDEAAATGTSIFQAGDVYRINVASAAPHAFSDISEDLLIGDWVVFNGTIFQKQDGTDPTAAETKTAYESNADTNAFTDAEQTKLGGIEALADVTDTANVDAAGAVMETDYNAQTVLLAVADDTPLPVTVAASSFVGRKAAGDVGTMTDAEARTVLNVEDGATADQTDAEIKTAYENNANTNEFSDAEQTKLSGIEALADVTDTANVDAAGAVMETDYNANTILAANSDNTPLALAVLEQTLVGRITAGNITDLTPAQVRTLLNVEDGAQVNTVDDVFGRTGNVLAVASDYDASQIDNDSDVNGAFVDDALNRLLSKPWSLNGPLVENSPLDVSAQTTNPSGLYITEDGLRLYTVDFTSGTIFQYSLSIPYKASSGTFVNSFAITAQAATAHGVCLSPDGLKMFVPTSDAPARILEYDLSVAFDITTSIFSTSLNISAQTINPRDIFFGKDGFRLYITLPTTPDIGQWTLTVPYDLTTATFDFAFDLSGEIATFGLTDVFFKDDGKKMFVAEVATGDIHQYSLATPWEINTALFDNITTNVGTVGIGGLFFKKHGATFYIADTTNENIREFEVAIQEDNPFTDSEKTKLARISYAERTESAKQTITGSGALILAHNLPGIPTLWYVILENKETEHNFSPGDQTRPSAIQSSSNDQGVGIVPDGSDLNIRYGSGFGGGSSVFSVVDKTTGDVEIITNSKWEAIFVAAL